MPTDLGLEDLSIAAEDLVYDGYAKVRRYRLRHRRYDGGTSPEVVREVFDSGPAVIVLPYDPVRETVLLVEQMRAGPLPSSGRPWVIECIAGRIDRAGESPEEVARREAMEEAGLTMGPLEPIGRYYPSPGIVAERYFQFVARADLGAGEGVHGNPRENEDIRTLIVPLEEALHASEDGRIEALPAAAMLWWLDRHRQRLKAVWQVT